MIWAGWWWKEHNKSRQCLLKRNWNLFMKEASFCYGFQVSRNGETEQMAETRNVRGLGYQCPYPSFAASWLFGPVLGCNLFVVYTLLCKVLTFTRSKMYLPSQHF